MKLILIYLVALLLAAPVFGEDLSEVCRSPAPILILEIGKEVNDPLKGNIYEVSIQKTVKDNYLASMVVWSLDGKQVVADGSLACLNEILRGEQVSTKTKFDNLVGTLILRVTSVQGRILFPTYIKAYLRQLASKCSAETMKKYSNVLIAPEFTAKDDSWRYVFLLLTRDGGVERKVFNGRTCPVLVTKQETEVLFEGGAIPAFDSDEWDRLEHIKNGEG